MQRRIFPTINEVTQRPAATWVGERSSKDFPTLRYTPQYIADHLIIGAGWMGMIAALILADLAPHQKIILVDEAEIGSSTTLNATGRNAGIVLDLAEESVEHLRKNLGDDKTLQIIHFGLEASKGIARIMERCGAPEAYQNIGYVTGFRSQREKDEFLKGAAFLHENFPYDYGQVLATDHPRGQDDKYNFSLLSPRETGSPEYFPFGGVYSPHGGPLDVPKAIHAVITTLQNMPNVAIYERTKILSLIAAKKAIFANADTKGNLGIEARHVLAAGGATYGLFSGAVENFPTLQPAATAMLLIEEIPATIVQEILGARRTALPSIDASAIPFQGSATFSPPYGRFVLTDDGTYDFYFGAGARPGKTIPHIESDVKMDLDATYPLLAQMLREGKVCASHIWAGTQHFAASGIPFIAALGYGKKGLELFAADEEKKARIYAGSGFGGHGIAAASEAGRLIGLLHNGHSDDSIIAKNQITYMRGWQPEGSLSLSQLQRAIASERPRPKRGRKHDKTDSGRQSRSEAVFLAKQQHG